MRYPETISRKTEARTKAQTIISQIPAMTRMACGFRNVSFLIGDGNADFDVKVTAKVGRANRLIEIRLELNDTYTVRLIRVPTSRAKDQSLETLEEHLDVYCEALGEVVYHAVNK